MVVRGQHRCSDRLWFVGDGGGICCGSLTWGLLCYAFVVGRWALVPEAEAGRRAGLMGALLLAVRPSACAHALQTAGLDEGG